jgi:hypothetical protein
MRTIGYSVIVAMRAMIGRLSLSTTARARISLNVSVGTCIGNSRARAGWIYRRYFLLVFCAKQTDFRI